MMALENYIIFDIRPNEEDWDAVANRMGNIYVNLYFKTDNVFLGRGIFNLRTRRSAYFIGFKIGRAAPYLSFTWDDLKNLAIEKMSKKVYVFK